MPFRDPSGRYECILPEHERGAHKTRLYGEDGVEYVTYVWVDNPGDHL